MLRRHLTGTDLFPSQRKLVIEGYMCRQRENSNAKKMHVQCALRTPLPIRDSKHVSCLLLPSTID